MLMQVYQVIIRLKSLNKPFRKMSNKTWSGQNNNQCPSLQSRDAFMNVNTFTTKCKPMVTFKNRKARSNFPRRYLQEPAQFGEKLMYGQVRLS